MNLTLAFVLYEALLLFTAASAISRWRFLSNADKWIAILLLITILQEGIAGVLRTLYVNNFITYHIYTPIELYFIINYFIRATRVKNATILGITLGLFAVLLSILNTIYLQGLKQWNSYYLLFEGIVVICFCLFSFYRILIRDNVTPKNMALFWISSNFLFYWCLTFINVGMYPLIIGTTNLLRLLISTTLLYANLLFYAGIAIVFLRYKKLVPSGE